MFKLSRLFILFTLLTTHIVADVPTFDTWNFVLWDYADEVIDTPTAVTHWQNLIKFVAKNKVSRVITMIKNPASFPFFDITKQQGNSCFLYYAKQFVSQFKGECELCVFFDRTSFTNPKYAPAMPQLLPNVFNNLNINDTTFLNLNDKMSWLLAMAPQVNISEVALDPECDFNSPDKSGPLGAIQLLLNYMNYFRNAHSNQLKNIRIGVCYGFDEKNMSFVNLSNLPLPSNNDEYNLDQLLPSAKNYYYFPTKFDTNWQTDFTAPLIDSVYIEAYDNTTPYNFTLQNNPPLAATNMLHLNRDEAYMPGAGTISVNSNNANELDGIGTQFTTQVTQSVPVNIQQADGSYQLAGLVNTVVSDTVLTLNSPAEVPGKNANYMISESALKWSYPSIDQSFNPQLLGNICMMFSIEQEYFGHWTLDQFLQFVNTFYTSGQTTGSPALPIYSQAMTPGDNPEPVYINLPKNFGVYDYYQIQTNSNYSSLLP